MRRQRQATLGKRLKGWAKTEEGRQYPWTYAPQGVKRNKHPASVYPLLVSLNGDVTSLDTSNINTFKDCKQIYCVEEVDNGYIKFSSEK